MFSCSAVFPFNLWQDIYNIYCFSGFCFNFVLKPVIIKLGNPFRQVHILAGVLILLARPMIGQMNKMKQFSERVKNE